MKLRKINRIISHRARQGRMWCWACDRSFVRAGQKCKVCGSLMDKKVNKKPAPYDYYDCNEDYHYYYEYGDEEN